MVFRSGRPGESIKIWSLSDIYMQIYIDAYTTLGDRANILFQVYSYRLTIICETKKATKKKLMHYDWILSETIKIF